MLKDRQPESGLGDEKMARNEVESGTGRVGGALVVAGDHDANAFPLDEHLGAAEHVAGGNQGDSNIADTQPLAIGEGLGSGSRRRAEARFHDRNRFGAGEHMLMSRPRMVGVPVRDHRPLGPRMRIDMEVAGPAVEALAIDGEPAFEPFGYHFIPELWRTKHAFWELRFITTYLRLYCAELHSGWSLNRLSNIHHSRADAAGGTVAVPGGIARDLGAGLRASGAGGLFCLCCWLFASAASAQPDAPRSEYFTGFEVSDNYVSAYVGGGYAFGKAGLYEPGFRLRAVGAYGPYRYEGTLRSGDLYLPQTFQGEAAYLAALIGYQFRPGRVSLKLFAGIEAEDQHIVPHDPDNAVQGSALGLKLQAESWLDLSERLFLSADAAYGTAFEEYFGLARLGYRVRPRLSLGLEGGTVGNEEYDAGRGGGFVRANFRRMEATLSGGFTGNYLEDDPSFYVALGIYRPF